MENQPSNICYMFFWQIVKTNQQFASLLERIKHYIILHWYSKSIVARPNIYIFYVNMSGRGYYVIVCSWNVIVALSNAVYTTILC